MPEIDKKSLSERDICSKFITPALTANNTWDLMNQLCTASKCRSTSVTTTHSPDLTPATLPPTVWMSLSRTRPSAAWKKTGPKRISLPPIAPRYRGGAGELGGAPKAPNIPAQPNGLGNRTGDTKALNARSISALNDFGNWAAPLALKFLGWPLDLGRCPGVAPGWYGSGLWPASLRAWDGRQCT